MSGNAAGLSLLVLAFLLGFQAPARKGPGAAAFIFLPAALLDAVYGRGAGSTVLGFLALVFSVVALLKARLGGEASSGPAEPEPPAPEQGSGN